MNSYIQNDPHEIKNRSIRQGYWLIAALFFIFIFPIPPRIFGFAGEGFALLVCLSILFLFSLSSRLKIFLPSFFICILLFGLLSAALLRDIDHVIVRDFFELLRPLFWLVIFSFFYNCFGGSGNVVFLKSLMNFILFCAVWGIAEVLLPLPASYSYIYRLPGSVYDNKAIASFIAPYAYAAVIGIGAIFFFVKSKIQDGVKNCSFSFICIMAILLSQSKSAIFGILIIIPLLQMSYNKTLGLLFMLPLMFLVGAFVVLSGGFNYVTEFAVNVFSAYSSDGIESLPGASPSIGNRVQQFEDMFRRLDPVFLFGRGIGKDYLYLESSPALILFRYGVMGFIIIILIFVGTLRKIRSTRKYPLCPDWEALNKSFTYLFIFFGIVSLSANLIDQFKVAFFYVGLLALLFAYKVGHAEHTNVTGRDHNGRGIA